MTKPIWASKTMITNGVALAASLLAATGKIDIPPDLQAEFVVAIFAIVNIVLRFVTKDPVSLTGK